MFVQLLEMLLVLVDLRFQCLQLLHFLLAYVIILIRLLTLAESITIIHESSLALLCRLQTLNWWPEG